MRNDLKYVEVLFLPGIPFPFTLHLLMETKQKKNENQNQNGIRMTNSRKSYHSQCNLFFFLTQLCLGQIMFPVFYTDSEARKNQNRKDPTSAEREINQFLKESILAHLAKHAPRLLRPPLATRASVLTFSIFLFLSKIKGITTTRNQCKNTQQHRSNANINNNNIRRNDSNISC